MHRWVDHTAEVELEVKGASPESVLCEAALAVSELLDSAAGPTVSRRLAVEAADLPALLAAWLDEIVFLAEAEGLVAVDVELTLAGTRLEATVEARHGRPRPIVKAVTLHRLRLEPVDGAWHGRVVLDV